MSLKKKITLSFLISVFIIALLVAFEYINFIEIKKEISVIEFTDTVRSKSLQIRRHEKNYFLKYSKAKKESEAVHQYLYELNSIISAGSFADKTLLRELKSSIKEYEQNFNTIESLAGKLSRKFEELKKTSQSKWREMFPFMGSIMIEHPIQGVALLEKSFSLPSNSKLASGLKELDSLIDTLRKNGEDILAISEELDRIAREHMDKTIQLSQVAIFIFLPLFFITGIGTIILFNKDVVNRLKTLIEVVEKTGTGSFSKVALIPGNWSGDDEVVTLIREFNKMEEQLAQREEELEKKNKELFQSKKLAAIGTLASGVAHELNNPLNNIYISTQILVREIGKTYPSKIKEVITDIHSQTLRVKRIVGDLLEFARGREPQPKEVNLYQLIENAHQLTCSTVNMERVRFVMDSDTGDVVVRADPEQLERVFINLFANAVEAMSGEGELTVSFLQEDNYIKIKVSDTGKGMSGAALEKVFEPFYTTKDKGTGLGLAIVFNIINKHGGSISIQSEAGRGTTFIISLPKETV
jgi:two-component system NtrC family sensor kinase